MARLFNKTFFRFLFGFLAIIMIGFMVMAVTGYIADNPGKGGPSMTADTHK